MKKILIVYNPQKNKVKQVLSSLSKKLNLEYGVKTCSSEKINLKNYVADLVLTLGGDGTILRVGDYVIKNRIPVMGINLGSLGYLAEFQPREVYPIIKKIFLNKISFQKRVVLEVKYKSEKYFVINDCVIKPTSAKVINVELYIDGKLITNIIGDGIIIATPTGSTAYSLASGGSIVEPEAKVILITPICPHSLSNRPIIVSEERVITIKIPQYKSNHNILMSIDGQKNFYVNPEESFIIKLSNEKLFFIPNPKKSFYTILKQKLNWAKR